MTVTERALNFSCQGQHLVGVVSLPAAPRRVGMLIVVGGPQYRAGSHRQFVQLARRVAAEGHAVLRFDCRGMGDSGGEQRSFEDISPDIAAAVQALLQAAPAVQQVVLWGLCDGASAALLYLGDSARDPRVTGLCLVNPWLRSQATLARTHVKHYYTQRLRQPEFWAKLLRGGVAWQALCGLARSLRLAAAGAKPTNTSATAEAALHAAHGAAVAALQRPHPAAAERQRLHGARIHGSLAHRRGVADRGATPAAAAGGIGWGRSHAVV